MRHLDNDELSRARMTNAEGELGRPIAMRHLEVPIRVELDETGERLMWNYGTKRNAQYVRHEDASKSILNTFANLADRPVERIRDFARKWGPLEICAHGWPASHNRRGVIWLRDTLPCSAPTLPGEPIWYWESIERWRFYSRQANALLHIGAKLHQGQLVTDDEWSVVRFSWQDRDFQWMMDTKNPKNERATLAALVSDWLQLGGVQPALHWTHKNPQIELEPQGLFGVLAVNLALAVGKSDGFAYCSACGKSYIPNRKPQAGRRNYCSKCGEDSNWQKSWRDSKRDAKKRKLENV